MAGTFRDDVTAGLTALPKSIPARWFYDDLGSALFEAICHLPEYYVTRAETEILREHAAEIVAAAGPVTRIIELGSGSARKTRMLFDECPSVEYVPVDIDGQMLERLRRELSIEYPELRVTPVRGDFTDPARALAGAGRAERTLALFLGSTIGNFHPEPAAALLRGLQNVLNPGDAILLGADLKKPHDILHAAYNDALGVTAAFNLNVLQRINRELGGHFDLTAFAHRAFYDPQKGRIEMHLVSVREQRVRIDDLNVEVSFAKGETIHTENSYKYDADDLARIAGNAGLGVAATWTDAQGWFADAMLRQ